jgi:hypothetical protein
MEVNGQLHDPAALPLGKETSYTLDRKLGGPHSWSRHCGIENISWPCREWNSCRPARTPSLYGLCYPEFVIKHLLLNINWIIRSDDGSGIQSVPLLRHCCQQSATLTISSRPQLWYQRAPVATHIDGGEVCSVARGRGQAADWNPAKCPAKSFLTRAQGITGLSNSPDAGRMRLTICLCFFSFPKKYFNVFLSLNERQFTRGLCSLFWVILKLN